VDPEDEKYYDTVAGGVDAETCAAAMWQELWLSFQQFDRVETGGIFKGSRNHLRDACHEILELRGAIPVLKV